MRGSGNTLKIKTMKNQPPFDVSSHALERKILFGSSAALFILFLLSALSFVSVIQDRRNRQWVEHTHQVIESVQELEKAIGDPQRGVLSRLSQTQAEETLSAIQQLTIDNPRQQENLRRMGLLILQRFQSGGLAAQTGIFKDIHRLLNAMEAEEKRLLRERDQRQESGSRHELVVILLANVTAVGMLAFGVRQIHQDLIFRQKAERSRREHEEQIEELNKNLQHRADELSAVNKELETFSYSVSHDLRAPLRAVDGFSREIAQSYGAVLDQQGKDYLSRIRSAAARMAQLIDDLLMLSRVTRADLHAQPVDLGDLANAIVKELRLSDSKRQVEFRTSGNLQVIADPRLIQIVLENLFRNAWKFTGKHAAAVIELGSEIRNGKTVYYVRDDGAGFDMAYSSHLFAAFQRLHTDREFPGTGVGLATVQRIIHRHRGEVWAEAQVEKGATFYFTLN